MLFAFDSPRLVVTGFLFSMSLNSTFHLVCDVPVVFLDKQDAFYHKPRK